ncbi:hypothetical protein [Ramlibacter henchirensis]|uniref:hypothetical protein n=1 Tax=Ramlibacter henchirensis TaxID=204072 RepID=UPI001430A298|nr:hypothetical protein [Ramlibacter henchirensis]
MAVEADHAVPHRERVHSLAEGEAVPANSVPGLNCAGDYGAATSSMASISRGGP